MYLKVGNRKIEIKELKGIWQRFKGLKFVLEPITYGVLFRNKKTISTDFLCQSVDIVLTDKEDKILYMYEAFPSEKRIWPKLKVNNIYFLPLGSIKYLEIGQKLKITEK